MNGVVGAIGDTVGKAREFESQMKRVQSITNASGADFKKLEGLAKSMGASTAFSASEAAEGIQFLGMAGFDANDIMSALPQTLLLASAGSMDLGRAADIASNILSGMRLETEDLDKVVNTLAITATSSNTDVGQLGDAFKFVAGTSATAGVSLEETSAALGILADNAFQGSTGGTSLNAAFRAMLAPADKAEKMMEELGLTFVDNEGKLRPLVDITADLTDANLTAGEQIEIFGTEGARAISALVGSGVDRMNELTSAYKTNTTAAQDMADTNMDSLSGAMKSFESATEAVQLALASSLMPTMKNMLDNYVTPAVRGFASFIENLGGIAAIASDVQIAMSALWTGVGESIDKFFSDPIFREKMLGLMGDFVVSWFDTVVAWWGTLGQLFIDGATLLFTPIEQAGIAVWQVIKSQAVTLFGETVTGVKIAINGLITSVNTIGSAFGIQFDKLDITPITVDAPDSIEHHWGEVKKKWVERTDAMTANFKTNMEAVKTKATETAGIADTIFSNTPIAANKDLLALKKKYTDALVNDDDSIEKQSTKTGKKAGTEIAEGAGTALKDNKGKITDAFTTITDGLKGNFEKDLTTSFRTALGGDFKGALTSFGNNMVDGMLGNVAVRMSSGITDALFGNGRDSGFSLGGLFGSGTDGNGGFFGGFRKGLSNFFGGEDSAIGGFLGTIQKAIPAAALVALGMKYIAPPLMDGLATVIEAGVKALGFGGAGGGSITRTTQDAFKFDAGKFDSRLSRQLLSEGFDIEQTLTKKELQSQAEMAGLEGDILQYLGGANTLTVPVASTHDPLSDERDAAAVKAILDKYGVSQGDRDQVARTNTQTGLDTDANNSAENIRKQRGERVAQRIRDRSTDSPIGVMLKPSHISAVESFLADNFGYLEQVASTHDNEVDAAVEVIRTINQIGRGNNSLSGIPNFRGGGRVAGSLGSSQLIMAHGGEQVVPASTDGMGFLGGGSNGSSVNLYFNVSLSSPDVNGSRNLIEGEFGDLIIDRLKRDGFDGREVIASDGIVTPSLV